MQVLKCMNKFIFSTIYLWVLLLAIMPNKKIPKGTNSEFQGWRICPLQGKRLEYPGLIEVQRLPQAQMNVSMYVHTVVHTLIHICGSVCPHVCVCTEVVGDIFQSLLCRFLIVLRSCLLLCAINSIICTKPSQPASSWTIVFLSGVSALSAVCHACPLSPGRRDRLG